MPSSSPTAPTGAAWRPHGAIHFERKPVHDPFIARAGGNAMMHKQQLVERQRLDDEIGRAASPRMASDGRTVSARTLLTPEECAEVERAEAKTGRPVFVYFSALDASFEARLDGRVPAAAVAQRSEAGLVTGQAIVGG